MAPVCKIYCDQKRSYYRRKVEREPWPTHGLRRSWEQTLPPLVWRSCLSCPSTYGHKPCTLMHLSSPVHCMNQNQCPGEMPKLGARKPTSTWSLGFAAEISALQLLPLHVFQATSSWRADMWPVPLKGAGATVDFACILKNPARCKAQTVCPLTLQPTCYPRSLISGLIMNGSTRSRVLFPSSEAPMCDSRTRSATPWCCNPKRWIVSWSKQRLHGNFLR